MVYNDPHTPFGAIVKHYFYIAAYTVFWAIPVMVLATFIALIMNLLYTLPPM